MKKNKLIILIISIIIILSLLGYYLYQHIKEGENNAITLVVTEYGYGSCYLEYSYIDENDLRTEKKVFIDKKYEKSFINLKEIKIYISRESYDDGGAKYSLYNKNILLKEDEIKDVEEEIKMEYKF